MYCFSVGYSGRSKIQRQIRASTRKIESFVDEWNVFLKMFRDHDASGLSYVSELDIEKIKRKVFNMFFCVIFQYYI